MRTDRLHFINKTKGNAVIGMYIENENVTPHTTPLYDCHKALDARFIVFGGSLWVDQYGDDIVKEYVQLNTDVAISDISSVTLISVKGPHVLRKIAHCFTNKKVTARKPHSMSYGGFVGGGQLVDDGMVFVVSEEEVMLTVNLDFEEFTEIFDPGVMAGCTLADLTERYVKIQIQGPAADGTLKEMFAVDPFPFFQFRVFDGLIAARCGFTLPGGYEVYLPVDRGVECWKKMIARGITPFGISVMEISRVESMKICQGHEFGARIFSPAELGFLGDDPTALEKEQTRVALAYFVSGPITGGNEVIPEIGHLIKNAQGELYGIVTSCVYSPHYDRYAGFCHIKKELEYDSMSLFCNGFEIHMLKLLKAKNTLQKLLEP
jgi:aminomethyltransferase